MSHANLGRALFLVGCITASAFGQLSSVREFGHPAPRDIVETAVLEQLAVSADGRVYVIAMLTPVAPQPRTGRAAQQAEVAAVQERVLGRLTPGDLDLRYRYENISALTGRVTVAGLMRLASDPDVVSVGVDARGRVDASACALTDTSVSFINADEVHSLGFTGAGTTVAVIDTGIDTDHPDLIDDIALGAMHFLDAGATVGPGAEDVHGHGTHVSGTITSAGVVAPVGVAPDADILAVQVIGPDGSGWISDFTAGIDYVVSVMDDYDDLCAINMSLGSFELFAECPANDATTYNAAMQAALLAAWVGGSATFASSGNNGECGSMTSPACLSSAVAVAAVYDLDLGTEPDVGTYADEFGFPFGDCSDTTTGPDEVTCFTNRSECNELAAPGRDINSSCIGGGQCANTGTSMASPHCAGVAALLCEETPTITPGQIVDLLKTTGVATSVPCAGFPNPIRIDAKAAIDAVVPTLSTSGLGLGGSGGVPVLTGVSTLLTGDPIELVMQKALENSTSTLVVGVSALFASFKGGTLVPHPDLLLIGLPVDGSGRLVLQGTWPPGIPSGTGIWFQHWVTDQAGPAGFSASNGLGGTVP